jgi:hypothetical protein
MSKHKISKRLSIFLIGTVLVIMGLALVVNMNHSWQSRIRTQKVNLAFGRKSIRIFAEQNGRFPHSLYELNDYAKKSPQEIPWRFPPSEFISGKSNSREHSFLDGTGGLYYNPKTGELKLNLTRPLNSYWKLYLGEERNEVPAEW